jgi:hypothetical protein
MALKFEPEKVNDFYIKSFINDFVDSNNVEIEKLCLHMLENSSSVSLLATKEVIRLGLYQACYTFVNKQYDRNVINTYLFGSIKNILKNIQNKDKQNIYICPGCKYLSRVQVLRFIGGKLVCESCSNSLEHIKNQWEELLYKSFMEHSLQGYQCPLCTLFIPSSKSDNIKCPYPDCIFIGYRKDLKLMRHPLIKANINMSGKVYNYINTKANNSDFLIDDFDKYYKILNDTIDEQISLIHYKSHSSTFKIKICMYKAIKNTLEKYPTDMISYLILMNKITNMQNYIFQEFVDLLSLHIPFSFKKSNKLITISSLLDQQLGIFDGISNFNATIQKNNEIPNLTNEIYVGGRKGSYCRPFYIGKILDITDIDTGTSLMPLVEKYSFTKIKMKNEAQPGTDVVVSHMRIYPHYQMGGLAHLNKIRRLMVDKVYFLLNGKQRDVGKK